MNDPTAITDALRTFLAPIIRDELRAVLSEIAPRLVASSDDVIAVERAPELGLTKRVLSDAIHRGDLPGIKLGRKLGAKRSAIISWRDARTVRPRPALADDATTPLDQLVAADFDRLTAS